MYRSTENVLIEFTQYQKIKNILVRMSKAQMLIIYDKVYKTVYMCNQRSASWLLNKKLKLDIVLKLN